MANRSKKRVLASVICDADGDVRLRSFLDTLDKELSGILHAEVANPSALHGRIESIKRLRARCRKKAIIRSDEKRLEAAAFASFKEVNAAAGLVNVTLPQEVINDAREFITNALERFTYENTGNMQCALDMELMASLWRYGPGSSRGSKATHFADKVRLKEITCTKDCAAILRYIRRYDPHLRQLDAEQGNDLVIVAGSSMSTVAKNEDVRRTICTEPLGNMQCQLAGGAYIEGALRTVGLDISNQWMRNKQLALIGSITGRIATLDLKNASEFIVMALIELLWPPVWVEYFKRTRSPCTQIDGDTVTLNMVATMGNGFTFPMMTMTLLALVYAALPGRRLWVDYETTAVFGDDMIVKTSEYANVCDILHRAGLVVNHDKSFAHGPFRESCGGDYWRGYDVTPFYVKSLSSDPEVYVAINQLLRWSTRSEVVLSKTFDYLLSLLHSSKPYLVPEWEDPSSGILCSQVSRRYKRWDVVKAQKAIHLDRVHPAAAMLMVTGGFITSTGTTKSVSYDYSMITAADGLTSPFLAMFDQEVGNPDRAVRVPTYTHSVRVCYTPRANLVAHKLVDSRLPRGYLDGCDRSVSGAEKRQRFYMIYGLFS